MDNSFQRSKCLEFFKSVVDRADEVRNLLLFLNKTVDWENVPVSRRSNRNIIGHSIDVTTLLVKLNDVFSAGISLESLVICGMFHDLGKLGAIVGTKFCPRFKVVDGELHCNSEVAEIPLSVRSLYIISHFISLNQAEVQAIVGSEGLYGFSSEHLKYKECNLTLLLHWADYWVSHVIEKGNKFNYDLSFWRL